MNCKYAIYAIYASSVAMGGHVPTLPRTCWVVGFAQIRLVFLGRGTGDGGRTRQQTCVEKYLTAANCLYT